MAPTIRPALLWPSSLLVGVAVFFATCLVEPAEHHTLNFGTEYGAMAVAPFDLIGTFPHRILGPLVANVLGLAGERYWLFAHGCTTALIAMVFAAAVLLGARWWQALLLTAVIAFTGTVQIYKGHVGYPDPITWSLMLATMLAARRPVWFWSLQLLNVMNHEQILFFWPWLLWWRHREDWREGRRWLPDLIGGGAVVAGYVAWRYHVSANAPGLSLTFEHYSALDYFPVGTLGLAALNVVSTYIWFGVLPVIVAWHAFVEGWRRVGFGLLLYLVLLHAVFGVAHDVYRFTCFLFVPVLLAGLRLLREPRGAIVLAAAGVATVVAFFAQRQVFVDVAIEVMKHLPTPVMSIVPKVIPAMPWTFVAYGLALVATIVAGWAWARWSRGTGMRDRVETVS